jgi:hypothetical protein
MAGKLAPPLIVHHALQIVRTDMDVCTALQRLCRLALSCGEQLRALRRPNERDAGFSQLSAWLYANWYSIPDPRPEIPPVAPGREALETALRAALPASRRWHRGWVVVQCARNGFCLAGYRDRRRELRPGDYANLSRPGMPVMPGDRIAVTDCIDWLDAQTGFWCAQSLGREPSPPLSRVYWSVNHDQVGAVLADLAATLDVVEIRYSLKCPAYAAGFARVDSLVLYLEREGWPVASSLVAAVAARLGCALRDSIPPLTLKIAPGLAFAEDPGDGKSFGESRCDALAAGIAALTSSDTPEEGSGVSILARSLDAAGIDPAQPWLNGKK